MVVKLTRLPLARPPKNPRRLPRLAEKFLQLPLRLFRLPLLPLQLTRPPKLPLLLQNKCHASWHAARFNSLAVSHGLFALVPWL